MSKEEIKRATAASELLGALGMMYECGLPHLAPRPPCQLCGLPPSPIAFPVSLEKALLRYSWDFHGIILLTRTQIIFSAVSLSKFGLQMAVPKRNIIG